MQQKIPGSAASHCRARKVKPAAAAAAAAAGAARGSWLSACTPRTAVWGCSLAACGSLLNTSVVRYTVSFVTRGYQGSSGSQPR